MNYDDMCEMLRMLTIPLGPMAADAITKLRAERDALAATRIAYASEFPLNADGEPDVGNIHANLRTLKSERDALAARHERALIAGAELREQRDALAADARRYHVPLNVVGSLRAITPERLAQLLKAEVDLAAARSRISYLEPIFIAARELVDNAEEYECDGLGLWAQHGWWEPLHDALDPDDSEAADDIRQPITPAK